jgi:hypothetical protein
MHCVYFHFCILHFTAFSVIHAPFHGSVGVVTAGNCSQSSYAIICVLPHGRHYFIAY